MRDEMHIMLCKLCECHDDYIDLLNERQNWGMTTVIKHASKAKYNKQVRSPRIKTKRPRVKAC